MKTINLTAVSLRPTLTAPAIEQNMAKEIGDAIYRNSKSITELRFGEKLYDSSGDIEVSDEEIGFIKAILPGFFFWAQEAINKILEE